MVRRAERGVGLAIRKGQDEGTVATLSENRSYAGQVARAHQRGETPLMRPKPSATEIASEHHVTHSRQPGVCDLADHVTDERFDEALTEAKDEGNLSRANVARKVRGETPATAAGSRHEVRRHVGLRRCTSHATGNVSCPALHATNVQVRGTQSR